MNIEKTKEQILESLEGKKIFKCSFCNRRVMLRKSWARVEVIEDEDGLKDNMVDGFEEYEYSCAKCGEEVSELN